MLADSRRTLRITVAALAVLYYLVPWPALGPVASWLGPPVFFLLLVVGPGVAVARLVGVRPQDPLEAVAWTALLGLFAALAGCFVWALWGCPLDLFRFGYPAIAVALTWTVPARDDHRLPLDRFTPTRGQRRAMLALVAFVCVVGAIVWVSGPPTHYDADTLDHAAYVKAVARSGDPFPTTANYSDAGADGADLRKSLMHALMGVAVRHLGIDPFALFAFLAGAQLVLLCLVVYTATRSLFDSRNVAIAATIAFALAFDGGIGGKIVRTMFYTNRFGMAPLLLFVAAAMACLARPSRRLLWLCALMGFTAAAVHLQYTVFVAMAAGIIVVWKACSPCATWGTHLRRSLAIAFATGLAILPYAAYRFATGFQTNEMHKEVQGAMFVGGGLFVADPWIVWSRLGWMGLAALVATVPLWRYRREVPGIGFTIASLLTVLFIVLNPLVMPIAFDALTYLAYRLGRVVPTYMIAGFLVVCALGLERRYPSLPPWRAWRRVAAALAFVAIAIGALNAVANRHIMFASSAEEARVSHTRWAGDIAAVTAGLPDDAVIASDPVTSYYLSALTRYAVLCTLDQHAPPNDRRAGARMAAARDILSPYTTNAEKLDIVDAWGVTHILVNADLPEGLVLNYWTLDPDVAENVHDVLQDRTGAFVLVARSGKLSLFARGPRDVPRRGSREPLVPVPPQDARPVGKRAGEATLVAARLDEDRARSGDTIGIDLFWTRTGPTPPGNYVVALRFDYDGLELPLGGRPFPKIARKIKERIDGVDYRFRDDHTFQRGFYGPERWPAGAIVHDPTTVRVPRGLAPGTYTVRAKLMRVPPTPNTDLHSYLYDDDIYSGVVIGRIEIGGR